MGSLCHEQPLRDLCLLFYITLSLLLSYSGTVFFGCCFSPFCTLLIPMFSQCMPLSLSCLFLCCFCTKIISVFSLTLSVSISPSQCISVCLCAFHICCSPFVQLLFFPAHTHTLTHSLTHICICVY